MAATSSILAGHGTPEPREAAAARDRPTRVFISYSRKDAVFAERLNGALAAQSLDPYFDKEDILPGEPWKERLGALILSADAVVFIVSPDSIGSAICSWEIEETERRQKRLLPVVYRAVTGSEVPPRLARLNYIHLRDVDDFSTGVSALADAINRDIGWVREHTRIGELARRWEETGHSARAILRGEDIAEAERWRDNQPKGAPRATPAQLAFITASRQAATRRQRYTIGGSIAAAAIALTLAGLAYWQRNLAVANEAIARDNEARATRERDQALRTQSLFLADQAQQKVAAGDDITAMLLSLEALPGGGSQSERPFVPEAELSLSAGWYGRNTGLQELAVLRGHTQSITAIVFSADGSRLLTASFDGTARLWDTTTGTQVAILSGHRDQVLSARFSRDGARLLTASRDGTARLWEARTGAPRHVLQHDKDVLWARFVGDGTRIVTSGESGVRLWSDAGTLIAVLAPADPVRTFHPAAVSSDGSRIVADATADTAAVWDAMTGTQLAVMRGHEGDLRLAGFSADGSRVFTASDDGTARIWDSHSGAGVATFKYERPDDSVFNPEIAVNADATRAVTAQDEGILWDVATGQPLATFGGHKNPINGIAFSPDGTRIFTKSVDALRLWDAVSGREVATLGGYQGTLLQEAHFSGDGTRLISTSHDKTARLWDAKTGAALALLSGHEDSVWDAAFSDDGRQIVTEGGTTLRLWAAPSASDVVVLRGHAAEVSSATFSPDGTRVATSSYDRTAGVWDVASGTRLLTLNGHTNSVTRAAFDRSGSRVVTAAHDGTVRVWNSSAGTQVAVLSPRAPGEWQDLETASFSPDGTRVAASTALQTRVWNVEQRTEILVLPGGEAAFTPDGSQVMTADTDGVVHFWDAASGTERGKLESNEAPIGVALNADGTRLVTTAGSETGDARAIIWDVATATRLAVAAASNGEQLSSAAFSPDGSRLVTASWDATARLWDAKSGAPVAVLAGHEGIIRFASFSPDRTHIVTASDDRTVRIWPIYPDTAALIEGSKRAVTRCLTTAERRTFFLGDEPPLWCIEMEKWPYSTQEWKAWRAARLEGRTLPIPSGEQ